MRSIFGSTMKSSRRLICIVLLLAPALCLGEAVPLPVKSPLTGSAIELDLRDSTVNVIVTPDQEAELTIEDFIAGEETSGFVLIEQTQRGSLRIAQPYGGDDIAPRLTIDLIVAPGQALVIKGRALTVTMRDLRGELGAEERKAALEAAGQDRAVVNRPGGVADRLRLDLKDSSAQLEGVVGAKLAGSGTRYRLDQCRGPFIFDLESSTADVDSHWGSLHLRGQDSDFIVNSGDQLIEYQLERGGLTVTQGMGSFKGRSANALVSLDQWDGDARLDGARSRLEVRSSGHEKSQISIEGEENDVLLEAVDGTLSLSLTAGSVEGEGLSGKVTLKGKDGARFELERFEDHVDLQLSEDSVAHLRKVAKGIKIDAQDSEVELEELMELRGRVSATTLSAASLKGTLKLVAQDAILDLDLTEMKSLQPKLELVGESQAKVALKDPCSVKVTGSDQARRELTLTGCDLLEPGARRPPRIRVRGQVAPVTLGAVLGDDAHLEVWSQ